MSDDPIPIRPGITPEFDAAREMIDWCSEKIREFSAANGQPISIALVVGAKGMVMVNSWSPNETRPTRGEWCAYAGALLLERAVK